MKFGDECTCCHFVSNNSYDLDVRTWQSCIEDDKILKENTYIEVIKNNPDIIKKLNENTYRLNPSKEKASSIYSEISGKTLSDNFEDLIIDFVIGDDNYLKNVIITTNDESMNIKLNAHYFNYGKDFNIILPKIEKT